MRLGDAIPLLTIREGFLPVRVASTRAARMTETIRKRTNLG